MLCLACLPAQLLAAQVRDLEQIRSCVRGNLPERSFSQKIVLKSWDAGGGSRELIGELFGERPGVERISLMLRIDGPADLAGARYLLNRRQVRDDMYVYLPAINKTRRITGGMKGQPLWGTDFSYEDIRHLQGSLSESEIEQLGDGLLSGRSVHQLRITPSGEAESAYSYLDMDVDQQSCLPLQVRFYDSSGMVKKMDVPADKIQQHDQRWVIAEVDMLNLRSQTRSSLRLSAYDFDAELSRSHFNPKTFHLAN